MHLSHSLLDCAAYEVAKQRSVKVEVLGCFVSFMKTAVC